MLNNKTYILKEFQSACNQDDLFKEIEVINHLKNKGLPVPEYIQTTGGGYYIVYNDRFIIMQKFISGESKEMNVGDYSNLIESASILAKITEALKDLNYSLPQKNHDAWTSLEALEKAEQSMQKFIQNLGEEFVDIKNDISSKLDILKQIKPQIKDCDFNSLTILNTHGDYNVLQFIYNQNKVTAVIDFISACKMPIVWEIIRSYSYIDKDAKNGEFNITHFIDYVCEFSKTIKLTKTDLELMPILYLCQLLTSNFGYKQYVLDTNKKDLLEFGKFRTNLCRYLFNNLDNLKEELLSNVNL
jgi:Ser/Thr protein kinase RdoA (MazF antagonist)